jgi:hypothetical protein
MTTLADLLANGLQLVVSYREPQGGAVHRVELTVTPLGQGSTRQPTSSPAEQATPPLASRDAKTPVWRRYSRLPGTGQAQVSLEMERAGYEWGSLTIGQLAAVERLVALLEHTGSADEQTGEHHDRHEPTDDHTHPDGTPGLRVSARRNDDRHWHEPPEDATDGQAGTVEAGAGDRRQRPARGRQPVSPAAADERPF